MLKLKELRESRGLTQQQVADHINKTFQAYSLYEKGKRQPDYDTLIKLAHFFNVTVDSLLGLPNHPEKPDTSPEVSPADMELLEKYKNSPDDDQYNVRQRLILRVILADINGLCRFEQFLSPPHFGHQAG